MSAVTAKHFQVFQEVAKAGATPAYTAAVAGIQVSEPPLAALLSSSLAAVVATVGAALAVPEAGLLVRPASSMREAVAVVVVPHPLAVPEALEPTQELQVLPTKAALAWPTTTVAVVAEATSAAVAVASMAAVVALAAVVDQASPAQPFLVQP